MSEEELIRTAQEHLKRIKDILPPVTKEGEKAVESLVAEQLKNRKTTVITNKDLGDKSTTELVIYDKEIK